MQYTVTVTIDIPATSKLSEEDACRALQDVIDVGVSEIVRTNDEDEVFSSVDLAVAAQLTYRVVFPPDYERLNSVIATLGQLLAKPDSEELQFALDDLVYDTCGIGRLSSDINNNGADAQARAIAARIGIECAIEELQAIVDDWIANEPAAG